MEKEKQLKEFNFHGLKLIGVYNPKLDSWWFRGKEVYRCLGVSSRMFSYYMKQIDNKHKKKLKSNKICKLFNINTIVTKNVTTVEAQMETLISESGLYRLATCIGKTKECEEFRKFVFEDLLVSLRKAEQRTLEEENKTLEEWIDIQEEWINTKEEKIETLEERVEYLEAQNAGLRAELNYWERKRKQARACLTDDRKNPRSKSNQSDWMFDYDNY